MNPVNKKSEKEEKAIEALITAALHQDGGEIDPATIAKYMSGDFTLTEEEEKALKQLPANPLLESITKIAAEELIEVEPSELMALHRNKPKNGFSKQTEEELARKRNELRDKLKKRKQGEA